MTKPYYIVFFIFLLMGCKPKENTTIAKEIVVTETKKDQTIYFFFEVSKENDTYKITVLKQQVTEAKLKGIFRKEIPINNRKKHHWLISFKDVNQNNIQIQIANPLIQRYEVGSIDGTVSGGSVSHNKAQFMVRIPYKAAITTIVFEKIIKNNNNLSLVLLDQINL